MSSAPAPTDTIVAPCTAAGVGERAIVRLSGSKARSLAFSTLSLECKPEPGCVVPATLSLAEGAPLPVEVLSWWAPRSLTGEDVVEVHLPAWPAVVTELVRRFVAGGARPAARGEFARRALALGKMDLPEVLALKRLMEAATAEDAAEAAQDLIHGETAERGHLRSALLDALALIEAHVDFEEEDTEEVGEKELLASLNRVRTCAENLGKRGRVAPLRDGETDVVLFGPPNAGKSLLFSVLCPGARTTISPVAGTTRDALEARVSRAGRSFRVLDGPGIVSGSSDAATIGAVDRLAMQRFVATLPSHAVMLLVDDAACPVDRETRSTLVGMIGSRRCVSVLNKMDLLESGLSDAGGGQAVHVSALRALGLDELWEAIFAASPSGSAPDLASRADVDAASAILPVLASTADLPLEGALPLLSWALRDAFRILEEEDDQLLDVQEEILDRIFSEFCVGK